MADEIITESDVYVEDTQEDISVIETVDIIEVSDVESYTIESVDAFPALGEGNEYLKHSLLNGRELDDQHPITAITGLREELNDIEALDVVYSNKRNQANYYLWNDENILQEDRVGYFVSVCSDINEIQVCTSNNDIFGVTVDGAGFIGAQSDISRDIKYGLVVTTGIAHVRCELSVNIGDYVVSNDYGYAQSNKNGYKVVGRHQIDGVEYAEITLVSPINRICELSNDVENVNDRMNQAETNIVSAINVANAAYNKAGEAGSISEEAVKNALEALNKSNETADKTAELESNVSSVNEIAVQAKAIAELATVSAEAIRNEAVVTSNEALAGVNDLIKDLESITTWSDPESGNSGAEYFTTYIKEGLATKAEVATVETLTDDNKSAIETNAENIQTLVSSVDKYSVGEYSQSYGLKQEQAKSILKEGMIYIPTKHSDESSHSEIYIDTGEENHFTPGYYYIWDGTDWIESSSPLVAFFSETPAPSSVLKYWYVDTNEAPEGYEAHALYVYDGEQWQKVNILDGNVNNRITSMIRQTTNEISAEVVNARESFASLTERIDENEAIVQSVVNWKTDPDGNEYSLATIKQTADDAGASIAQVVESVGENGKVSAASIVTAINNQTGDSIIKLNARVVNITADNINLEGVVTINDYIKMDTDGKLTVKDATVSGNITAESGSIGGFTIGDYLVGDRVGISGDSAYNVAFWAGASDSSAAPFVVTHDGTLTATQATITGDITAESGKIGNWEIVDGTLKNSDPDFIVTLSADNADGHAITVFNGMYADPIMFYLDYDGTLYAQNAEIHGHIEATSGTFTGTLSAGTTIAGYSLFKTYDDAYGNPYASAWCSMNFKDVAVGTLPTGSYSRVWLYENQINLEHGIGGTATRHSIVIRDSSGEFGGNWTGTAGISIDSDRNLKNTISLIDDQYSIFFDNLKPVTYKYNNGTSDRLHIGFIAQEVGDALKIASINTQDFAGLTIETDDEGNETWRLRYGEFVALNTNEIQKAKTRIAELENKVAELEALINKE